MSLADELSKQLKEATAEPNGVPGAIVAVVDRKGKLVFHDASGVRQSGGDEPMDKDALCWMASCTKVGCTVSRAVQIDMLTLF